MYELHNLGWSNFQKLCLTIVREILGQTVESFLDSNHGGRDGAFVGTWKTIGGEALSGRFVIQCKFTARPNHALRLADLKDEVAKVKRLVAQGRCAAYVILTNAGVSGQRAAQVEDLFRKAGIKRVLILGFNWVCDQIRENKNLRMQVPRLYGLGRTLAENQKSPRRPAPSHQSRSGRFHGALYGQPGLEDGHRPGRAKQAQNAGGIQVLHV
jgi:hypothetical protein